MSSAAETVHPLENKWVISEQVQSGDKQDKSQQYSNSFEKLCTFATVEEFWRFWSKIPTVG